MRPKYLHLLYSTIFGFVVSGAATACVQHPANNKEDIVSLSELVVAGCVSSASKAQAGRSYSTGFEQLSDFNNFYIVPQNYQNTATHQLSASVVRTGSSAHQAQILARGPTCPVWQNCNHRGYPTIQLHKTAAGGHSGMLLIEFYVYMTGFTINNNDWVSFATFSSDASDAWTRVVLVNLGHLNNSASVFTTLMHVPLMEQSGWTYQTTNPVDAFPMNAWNKISVCLNLSPTNGSAKVWQNGTLVSSAPVQGACGILQQAHFGLYASPTLSAGTMYNDDLTIQEVSACPY